MREQLSHNRKAFHLFMQQSTWTDEKRERHGLLKCRVHLSLSFLFILLVCFFPLISNNTPTSSPPLSLYPLSISHPFLSSTASFSSLFSSLCLPREKRFCLLLVSAPSQSAFLISSYCFCLIFKCYPRPNGNPYTHREKKSGERERGGKRNRLSIVFHSRTLRQSPHAPTPPRVKIWKVFLGAAEG